MLSLPKEVCEGNVEGIRQLHNRRDARAALAPLYAAYVVAMDARLQAQRLLRQPFALAGVVKRLPQGLKDTIRLCHASDGFKRGAIALQPERVPADRGPHGDQKRHRSATARGPKMYLGQHASRFPAGLPIRCEASRR